MDDVRIWSRRRNTPLALGWAVAGTAALVALWILLLVLSDLVGWSELGDVDNAWFVGAAAAGAVLAAESALAVAVGGAYERIDSIFGATLLALRPAGAWAGRNGILAFPVLLGVLAGIILLALLVPASIPAGSALALMPWVRRRYRRWRDQEDARERDRQQAVDARTERMRPIQERIAQSDLQTDDQGEYTGQAQEREPEP